MLEGVLRLIFICGIHFVSHGIEYTFWCLLFHLLKFILMQVEGKALVEFIDHIGSPLVCHADIVTETSSLRRPLLSFVQSFAGVMLGQVIMYHFIVTIKQ